MLKSILTAILLILGNYIFAQENTVGLLQFEPDEIDGYILFSPIRSKSSYLINACGQIINQWDSDGFPERMAYLTPEGNLVRTTREQIEVYDWDNNLIWSFDVRQNDYFQHHDITVLPNGNVIYIANEFIDVDTLEILGKTDISEPILSERLIEIQPDGKGSAEIVWEWSFIDHTVQDRDSSLSNYGIISENLGRININFLYQTERVDWIHLNSIMYNPLTDQILISSRNTSEIYVIDHSTSTSEAQTETGGTYGKGGDFLWRWGNPEVYRNGSLSDRLLFGQHDARWILEGEDKGKISVFNNGDQRPGNYSSVHIIDTSPFLDGEFEISADNTFLPNDFEWTFEGQLQNDQLYSFIEGGFMQIDASHFLISESISGTMYIIDKNGNLSWAYRNPDNGNVLDQFEDISFGPDYFKAQYYDEMYFSRDDLEFSSKGIIEDLNALSEDCARIVSTIQPTKERVIPTITKNSISFQSQMASLELLNLEGMRLKKCMDCSTLAIESYASGIYILQYQSKKGLYQSILIFK